ncbi:hypothetical protein C8Q75DRAFT_736809 [Abortiporus biennis]|nr:hypothetical protein C8Q75DRAFT_736809 [Abortiporus biennis]
MTDTLHQIPSFPPPALKPTGPRQGRQSHVSCASWISSLAITSPNNIPPIPITIQPQHSLDSESSGATAKLENVPEISSEFDAEYKPLKRPDSEEMAQMKVQRATSSVSAGGASRKSKAKSFVGGFVSSLKSIPKAMTHSQIYDRRTSSARDSVRSPTEQRPYLPVAMSGNPDVHFIYPGAQQKSLHGPYPMPFILAPPPVPNGAPIPLPPPRFTHAKRRPTSSSVESSRYGSFQTNDTFSSKIGTFLGELSSLPWTPQGRVAVDYIPGESRSRSLKGKASGSWYSITAPLTPSDITAPSQLLPDPWFPPSRLTPTEEVEEPQEEGQGDAEEDQSLDKKFERTREELQEKTMALNDLLRIVEHQKHHIGALETQISELQKEAEESQIQADLHRRRSSTRKSLLRPRDSVRTVTSVRRSISRPVSVFHD